MKKKKEEKKYIFTWPETFNRAQNHYNRYFFLSLFFEYFGAHAAQNVM